MASWFSNRLFLMMFTPPLAAGGSMAHNLATGPFIASRASCDEPRLWPARLHAQKALAEMKKHTGGFVATAPSPSLASWASTAAKTSDAYLVQLAESAGLKLATFDTGIPGAVQI